MNLFISRTNQYTFLACLCMSIMFWFLTKVSKEYTIEIDIGVTYNNLPKDKVSTRPLAKVLKLEVTGLGSDILKQLLVSKQKVIIDYEEQIQAYKPKNINDFNASTSQFVKKFQDQLSNFTIREIKPNSIPFTFQEKKTKKLPVLLQKKIKLPYNYVLKSVYVEPDSILVSGPKTIINDFSVWPTDTLVLKNVDRDMSGHVRLHAPLEYGVKLKEYIIKYTLDVEEFTGRETEVTVKKINLPPNMSIFLYPSKAIIKYQIGISNFDKVDENAFEVVADFKEKDIENSKEIELTIRRLPENLDITNIIIEPKAAKYVIME